MSCENIIVLVGKIKPGPLASLSHLELTICFLTVHHEAPLEKTIRHIGGIFSLLIFTMCCTPQSVPYGVLGDLHSLAGVPSSDTTDQEVA